ncbi:MAG: type II toxin-antitoxin system HicA family toxin [Phycisphaeraceae bacterium]|nr:MAG: type II toxin-antitoxin system HicA family toxin [Phycisphaeraceae bacterium]
MNPLPVVSGKETIRALERLGFERKRQRGSHVVMAKKGETVRVVTVPLHQEIARGTLRAIIRQADLRVEDFIEALKR